METGASLLNWFWAYLKCCFQHVQVYSVTLQWKIIPAGIPQRSVLGLLLFLIYTADLPLHVPPAVECDQFAEDTALCSVEHSHGACIDQFQHAVSNSGQWLENRQLSVNLSKTTAMVTSQRPMATPIIQLYNNVASYQLHLSGVMSADLRWNHHVDYILACTRWLLGV